jgi:hypothetical protein
MGPLALLGALSTGYTVLGALHERGSKVELVDLVGQLRAETARQAEAFVLEDGAAILASRKRQAQLLDQVERLAQSL